MKNPLVSVIVAVYNGERYLESALQSIFQQGYRPFEVIVVDDGSTDRSASIARAYPEIRYMYQSNQGVASARNAGVAAAQGECIAFLSHDDLWTPNKLSVQVNYMMAHPDIEYTVAGVKFFLEPGCPFPTSQLRKDLLEGYRVVRLMETLVARKRIFERIGRFDPLLNTAEDVDWFARANDLGVPMAVIDEVLLLKRIHDMNTSLNTPENNQNILTALKRSVNRKHDAEKRTK